jgi:acyl-CoA thioester hydrolase
MNDPDTTAKPEPLPETFDLTDRGIYGHWTHDVIRFADLDPAGHVNNIAFSTFFESGRVGFLGDGVSITHSKDFGWMAVRICVNFIGQLGFPGTVDIGTRVIKLGRSSVTLGAGLFNGEGCAATADCVMVRVDLMTNKSAEIPSDLRDLLAAGKAY